MSLHSDKLNHRGVLIHAQHDDWGPIEVFDREHHRYLYFGNTVEQSCLNKNNPAYPEGGSLKVMLASLMFAPEPERVLIIGLGGGALIRTLQSYSREIAIDVVEIRPALASICRDYFVLDNSPNLSIHIQDAFAFVSNLADKSQLYDIVFVDAFDANELAPSVQQSDFLEATERLIKENGVFCINLWSIHAETFQNMMRKVRTQFQQAAFALPVRGQGNAIGFGLKGSAAKIRWSECAMLARQLEERLGMEFLPLVEGVPSLPWDKRFL